MQTFNFSSKNRQTILALGAESAGNFSVYDNGKIYFSQSFGDLLEENNFTEFKKVVLSFLKKEKLTPDVILTDLHPLMKTTLWGEKLAKKYTAEHIQIQHHHAHIFSVIGEHVIQDTKFKIQNTIYGIAMDGTGYGEDEKIWGGEVFKVTSRKSQVTSIQRIGHLENQILLGSELAIQEPARMIISILSKFLSKKEVFSFVKKYYSHNEFELLYSQLQQNFNCLETSSAGRVLDAVSVLLGFSRNERKEKHGPTYLLENNSTKPYSFNPIIKNNILLTTPLFEYLIKNIYQDKKRLAATAQLYIAEGLHEIVKLSRHPERSPYSDRDAGSSVPLEPYSSGKIKHQQKSKFIALNSAFPETKSSGGTPELADYIPNTKYKIQNTFISGGLAENHIIKNYFISQGLIENKKSDVPRGDAGLSFGQIIYFLST